MISDHLKRLNDIRVQISYLSPFMGFVAQNSNILLRDDIQTAATNGKDIYFSPAFMDTLSDISLRFVFMHELLHIILVHPLRKKHRDHHRYNIACDIVINDYLYGEGYDYEDLPVITGRQFKMRRTFNETSESIYEKLPYSLNQQILDTHDMWDEALNQGIEEHIQDIFKRAFDQGIAPDDMIASQLNHPGFQSVFKRKPLVSKHVERYVKKHLQDYQFERIDPRYEDVLMPDFMPSGEQLFGIWLVLDVSYSMKTSDYIKIITDLRGLMKKYPSVSVHLSFFSNIVTEPAHIKNFEDLSFGLKKVRTTGGTNFDTIFESYHAYFSNNKRPQMIIIYTDGQCNPPEQSVIPNVDLVWFITRDDYPLLPGKVIPVNQHI